MFFAFRTRLIHQPFASNAISCMTQQLLLHYQTPQYDRHHFPVTGILLIIYLKKYGCYFCCRTRSIGNAMDKIIDLKPEDAHFLLVFRMIIQY